MAEPATDWERLIAKLAGEPDLAALADRRALVLVWSSDASRLLWSSDPSRWRAGPDDLDPAVRARLRDLGRGLAPWTGARFERLRLGGEGLAGPATFLCRMVQVGEEEALLTATIEPPAHGAGANRAQPAPAAPAFRRVPSADRNGVRFTWRMDASGRFAAVSDELAAAVGPRGADILGRSWADLVGRLVLDEAGAVGEALAGPGSWTRIPVLWRDMDGGRVIPVELSGAPADATAEAGARRGYGVAFPDAAEPAPPGRFAAPIPRPQTGEVAVPDRGVGPISTFRDGLGGAVQAAAALTSETVFGVLRAWFSPHLTAASGHAPPAEVSARPSLEPPESGGALSRSERGALHEIARALSTAAGEPDPTDAGRTADILPLPTRPRDPEAARILDKLPIGVLILRDETPLFANRPAVEAFGEPDLPSLVARGKLQPLFSVGSKALQGDGAATVRIERPSGQAGEFEMQAAGVTWGELPATLVSLAPLPDPGPAQRAAALELEVAARERRIADLNGTLEVVADAVVLLDASARIVWLSRSAEQAFGVAANEVVGDSIAALVATEDHRLALGCLERAMALAPGQVVECEVRGRREGATPLPFSMRVGRVEGASARFSVAFTDMSSFKALEEELREARGAAERDSANRAEFLARISHEIRTPLTAITGFAELMLEERFGPIGNQRYKGYVQDIHDSGVHVISLVNDLLDLAKATSGRIELSAAALDLNAVTQQCLALAAPLAARERTILRTSFTPGLPPVFADERSIRQVVLNLVANAIRFTGAGGQVIVSTVRGAHGDVGLRVRDTGPGMSAEEIEAALTPFRQVPSTRRGDGTGLGLPLSKALIEANRGAFAITSVPDEGTLIDIRLPVAPASLLSLAAE